jgi:deazaflavin-dependent oxidoreductase (nitroreductase family)
MPIEGEYVPSPWQWVQDQVEAYESSGGRSANTLGNTDWPVVIMTSRGRHTGTFRKTPLMRVEHDGEYALIGSLGGAPRNPVWVYNVRTNPDDVTLQDGPEPIEFTVRELTGDERVLWWTRAVAAYPPYDDYQKRTERLIPVFLATRRGNNQAG